MDGYFSGVWTTGIGIDGGLYLAECRSSRQDATENEGGQKLHGFSPVMSIGREELGKY